MTTFPPAGPAPGTARVFQTYPRRAITALATVLCALAGFTSTLYADSSDDELVAIGDMLPEAPPRMRAAALRYAETDLEQWHYLRTRISEERTVVDRHDPTLPGPEHWQLVSIDGREPTEEELEEFNEDRADHSEDREKATAQMVLGAILPGSVRPMTADTGTERYALDLQSPDGRRKGTYERLTGDLEVRNSDSGPWISSVRVWNRETLRPVPGIRIDEARIRFDFELVEDTVLPIAVTAFWAGELLMVKDLGGQVEVSLKDFRRAELPVKQTGSGEGNPGRSFRPGQ